jgi:L-iditol 2-dehydrogenase
MRAIAVTEVGRVEFVELPEPRLADYECLVRVRACGLCSGTDMRIIDGTLGDVRDHFPVILGHEGAGEVVEVGAAVESFAVGDLIVDAASAIEDDTYSAHCGNFCEYGIMQDLAVMAERGLPGACERFCSRRAMVVRAKMPAHHAVMLCTFKETLSAVRNFGLRPGMEVLILGDGPNGLSLAWSARHEGAGSVTMAGHWPDRLERARRVAGIGEAVNTHEAPLAEALGGRRFDLVIDAVGSAATVRAGLPMVRALGRLGVFGVLRNTDEAPTVREIGNGVALQMLQWPIGANEVHDEVVELVVSGALDPEGFISHLADWARIADMVEGVRRREVFKAVLTL